MRPPLAVEMPPIDPLPMDPAATVEVAMTSMVALSLSVPIREDSQITLIGVRALRKGTHSLAGSRRDELYDRG